MYFNNGCIPFRFTSSEVMLWGSCEWFTGTFNAETLLITRTCFSRWESSRSHSFVYIFFFFLAFFNFQK